MSFYNFNSTVGTQIAGNQYNSDSLERLRADILAEIAMLTPSLVTGNEATTVASIGQEISSLQPSKSILKDGLGLISGVSALTNLAEKIQAWLANVP